jgi:cytochrome c551/c552
MRRVSVWAASSILAIALIGARTAQSVDAQALLRKYDCHLCHALDETGTGPAYVEIATKYRGDPNAASRLAALVRKGAHGRGPWHMPPLPQVPEADARAMVDYILAARK